MSANEDPCMLSFNMIFGTGSPVALIYNLYYSLTAQNHLRSLIHCKAWRRARCHPHRYYGQSGGEGQGRHRTPN